MSTMLVLDLRELSDSGILPFGTKVRAINLILKEDLIAN